MGQKKLKTTVLNNSRCFFQPGITFCKKVGKSFPSHQINTTHMAIFVAKRTNRIVSTAFGLKLTPTGPGLLVETI